MDLNQHLRQRLQDIESRGLYRHRRTRSGAQGARVVVDGRELLSFNSNDYLGLAADPRVAEAMCKAARREGVGSGASHLVSGHGAQHHALEEELAEFVGSPRCLLFSTGYMANTGVIAALTGRGDRIYQDRLNHASLLDGARLSGASYGRYRHCDLGQLENRLQAAATGNRLIVSDSVFSMDGDLADVPALGNLAARYGSWLMVDDAHGFGVLGGHGRGILEHQAVPPGQVDVLVGTLGKACGSFGAFVAGSEELIEYLIQSARSYIYTTAMPAALVAATRTSLQLLREENWRRQKLQQLISRFRHGAEQLDLPLAPSATPIQPVIVGDSQRAVRAASLLAEQGLWVSAIRPPTVEQGRARLRITLSAAHDEQAVDRLLDALGKIGRQI